MTNQYIPNLNTPKPVQQKRRKVQQKRRKKAKWTRIYYESHQRFGRYQPVIYPWFINNINEALNTPVYKYI